MSAPPPPYMQPAPAPAPSFTPLQSPVVVVGPQYLAPYPADLVVTKKLMTLREGQFNVTDVQGNVMFSVKGSVFSIHDQRLIHDATGVPILSLRQKSMEENQSGTQHTGNSGSTIPSLINSATNDELYLHHSDHPNYVLSTSLLNERNYAHWRRSVEVSLMAKNKLRMVNGSYPRPDSNSPLLGQWERVNNMVISWLVHSVEKDIAESVLYCKTAAQIWSELRSRFGRSNRTRIYQVQRELNSLSQGSMSISTYFTKMKRLWDEYALLLEDLACTCGSSSVATKIMQDQHVIQFLMGLNEHFSTVRGNILMFSPPPNIDEVYQLILQEEEQRQIGSSNKTDSESVAFAAQRSGYRDGQKGDVKYCDHCKIGGHTMDKCWKIHGYPQKSTNESPNFCSFCKIPGHSIDKCWKVNRNSEGTSKTGQTESKFFCTHCKNPGHTIDRCWKLNGYPPGRGNRLAAQASSTTDQNSSNAGPTGFTQQQISQLINLLNNQSMNETNNHAAFLAGPFDEETCGDWA